MNHSEHSEPTTSEKENLNAEINFFSEEIDFQLAEQAAIRAWIERAVAEEKSSLTEVSYIFCSDEYLHQMNVDYLQHDTLTDIITFPYSKKAVEGDIFISIDRVRENAATYGVAFQHELQRVMIHGILHLLGYKDKTEADQAKMTEKENYYLEMKNK